MASPGPNKLFPPSNLTAFLQHEILPSSSPSSHVLDSFLLHHSDPSFQGSKPLVDFENVSGSTVTELPFFQQGLGKEDNTEEEYDACFHQPAGKKRRLTDQQVQFLEKNFELENKLEPERKIKLGKELGLRPRQVAIWFQNRRARFKTKQLEKDYTTLKSSYDKLKSDYDNLLHQNDKLKEEVNSLKNKLIGRDHEEKEEDYDKCADVLISNNNNGVSENRSKVEKVPTVICKQEDANSAKSDVFDSDSPHHTADSSHAEFETEHSDFSQDEEDNLSRRLRHHHRHHNLLSDLPCLLPKVEEEPCNFGFPFDQDQAFCFWSY